MISLNVILMLRKTLWRVGGLVLLLATLLFGFGSASAQDPAQLEQLLQMPLPMNPKVRYGQLDNGMVYYILANKEPRERAEFYIVHNVGAILENDDQQGLAHFTEHMAFNGTTHFPGKKLLSFLEHNGVKFGADVNAFTAREVTCYNISDVPTTRKGLLDSCMMVLCDWSGEIAFDDKEIDDERGVIMEELRTRRNAEWRARDVKERLLFKGSKYAERDVIGTLELLQTFPYQTIKDFYHKWYRPDLQAIIVVGDFDVDEMEARVKRMASAVRVPAEKTPKPTFEIPVTKGFVYGTYTDPEMQFTRVELTFRHDPDFLRTKTVGNLRNELIRDMAIRALNARFDELAQAGDVPILGAQDMYYSIVHPMDVYILAAVPKPGQLVDGYKMLVTEAQRAVQHGFLPTEIARVKSDMIRAYQSGFDERDKMPNAAHVWQCLGHFTANEAMPGIELEMRMALPMIESIEPEEVNAMIRNLMPSRDLLCFFSAPENEKSTIPSEEKAREIYNTICDSQLTPWVDNVKEEPLIPELPTPGTVVSEKSNQKFGTTEWMLSNGMKVILKPTDFKEDEVLLRATSEGGYSSLPTEDIYAAQLLGTYFTMSGLGEFDAVELAKHTAGKQVYVNGGIARFETHIEGESAAKVEELELMFQEIYLLFTAPRFDYKTYNLMMERVNTVFTNQENDPNSIFSRRLALLMNDDNPRSAPLSKETLKNVNPERLQSAYKKLFPGANNYTVMIVGNINPAQLKPLVCQYLASLPKGDKRSWKDDGLRYPAQAKAHTFSQKMETPKTRVMVGYGAKAKYTAENMIYISAIEHILGLRNTEEIREKEGGTYGVSEQGFLSLRPVPFARMLMLFDTDPQKAAPLIPKVGEIFNTLYSDILEDDVLKAKLHFLKAHGEDVRRNEYWLEVLAEYEASGVDIYTNYEKLVNALTVASVKKAMKNIFGGAYQVRLVMQGYGEE